MNYKLGFHPDALAEWRKLDATVSEQFKKKLAERSQNVSLQTPEAGT